MNKKQLTGNAKNRRQHEITDVLLSFYDTIDNEFRLFKEDDNNNNNNNNSHFNSIFKHKIENIRTTSDKTLTSKLVSRLENIPYIPSSIVTYIKEKITYVLSYSFRIDELRSAKVNFIIF